MRRALIGIVVATFGTAGALVAYPAGATLGSRHDAQKLAKALKKCKKDKSKSMRKKCEKTAEAKYESTPRPAAIGGHGHGNGYRHGHLDRHGHRNGYRYGHLDRLGTATGTGTTTGTGTATGTGTTGTTTAPPVEAALGWLTGVIHFVGGPYNPEFQHAPHAGWVHVRSLNGTVVLVTYVQGEFKIEVPAGVYQVFATEGQTRTTPEVDCTGETVEISSGQATGVTLDLGCGIP